VKHKPDNPHAELMNLMVELTRIAMHDTKKLHEAMKNLKQAYHSTDDHITSEMLIPRLQIAFRELSHYLIQIRRQTSQLQSITNDE